jgi:hypothetical protein
MSAATVIAYAAWAAILFFCVKWFIEGVRGTHKEKPQPPVKVKRWLPARTVLAWFLVVIFGMMNLAATGQQNTAPTESNDPSSLMAHGFGMLVGIAIRLGGLGLSLLWVRKLGRERRQHRLNVAEHKTATA